MRKTSFLDAQCQFYPDNSLSFFFPLYPLRIFGKSIFLLDVSISSGTANNDFQCEENLRQHVH